MTTSGRVQTLVGSCARDVDELVKRTPKPRKSGIPIVDRVRDLIMARGGRNGFRSLRRILMQMDDNGNRSLSKEELKSGLQTYGMEPTQFEMDTLMRHFDRDGDKAISVTEFVRGLRPSMGKERKDLVLLAHKLLDQNCDGYVRMGDLHALYDTSKHPQVLAGEKTDEQVMEEFAAGWDKNGDDEITEAEFMDYYEDISAGIDSDAYFELMLRNAWHISGGRGAAQCTTTRRVLVLYRDGREGIVEVKNDLGIGPDDKAKILQRLSAQGVLDVKDVKLTY